MANIVIFRMPMKWSRVLADSQDLFCEFLVDCQTYSVDSVMPISIPALMPSNVSGMIRAVPRSEVTLVVCILLKVNPIAACCC